MGRNGNGCKNARNSLVAATFEKANTYVFAALIIRDREVGGSNPLAPTNNLHPHQYLQSRALTVFRCVAIWGQKFPIHGIETTLSSITICNKTAEKREKLKAMLPCAPILQHSEPCALSSCKLFVSGPLVGLHRRYTSTCAVGFICASFRFKHATKLF